MGDLLAFGLLVLVVASGVCDLVARRVPNALILAGVGLQVVNLWLVAAVPTWLTTSPQLALLGFALGLLVFVPLWRLGAMGAGDVKFLAALGFALGPLGLVVSWSVASVLAGMHALGAVLRQPSARSTSRLFLWPAVGRVTRPVLQAVTPARAWLAARRGRRRGAPYVTYLAAGALAWVFIVSRQ